METINKTLNLSKYTTEQLNDIFASIVSGSLSASTDYREAIKEEIQKRIKK